MSTLSDRISHPCFPQPANVNQKVWRYIDLAKFINLISSKTLYFPRVDLLDDPFEGSTPRNLPFIDETLNPNDIKPNSENSSLKNALDRGLRMRKTFFVSCWRIDDIESEAMWKLYCPKNEGIAIQTTYQKLITSFSDNDEIFPGLIKYLNYETEKFTDMNAFRPIMHKRKAFEHEKEIRLVKPQMEYWNTLNENTTLGINVPWQIEHVAETIFVNPYAPEWYYETVKSLLAHFNLEFDIQWSALKSKPLFL